MIIVDRNSFIAWTEGILMERAGDKILKIGDNIKHEEAEEALNQGEKIGLTVKGELISTMSLTEHGFSEKLES